jgi:alkanesulfonate monooxygenase SsuD/methylene tetrahydromethanopterin reductase-like flavin-dependent oxidoreductase (luciferase family)
MKVWQFSEQSYYPAWASSGAMGITLPPRHCDPSQAGALLNRYLDDYILADELGLNIMVNEHHSTASCMSTSCMTTLAILARQTRNARLLALGIPLANRSDPVRIAEEIAMVDALSGGRLEVGLVKGAGYEVFPSNKNPVRFMNAFWEAHDLIIEALTNKEENFAWDGDHFQYRNVNVWPSVLQQPHPPIWMTASSASSAAVHAGYDYHCATFLSGAVARSVFDGYRELPRGPRTRGRREQARLSGCRHGGRHARTRVPPCGNDEGLFRHDDACRQPVSQSGRLRFG